VLYLNLSINKDVYQKSCSWLQGNLRGRGRWIRRGLLRVRSASLYLFSYVQQVFSSFRLERRCHFHRECKGSVPELFQPDQVQMLLSMNNLLENPLPFPLLEGSGSLVD